MIMIHRATIADITTIKALAERVWWAHYPDIISPEQITWMLSEWYNEAALLAQMQDEGHEFWLVPDHTNGTIVGYISISRKPDGTYYLHKFYMDGRGQGLGAKAFEALIGQYPDLRELRLNVNRRNFKSVNFYFKVGFRIESWMDLQVGEGFVMDDFVMVWKR
jgi:diamine N-acetyltransferase